VSAIIRQQVFAAIIACMSKAMSEGRDPQKAAEHEFPGVPGGILGEAYGEALAAEDEAWWRTLERTIDGELIRSAITAARD
jgi:hypothetical protein